MSGNEAARPKHLESLIFGEYLTTMSRRQMLWCAAGEGFAHKRGIDMEFEAKRNGTQLFALLMTFVVVGGAIAYAMMA